MEDREPTTMARAAVRPRMLVLLVLLLAAAAVCARLGVWQLDRAQLRGDAADAAAAQAAQPAVPLDDVLPPQTSFRSELVAREVTATGTYQPEGQLLVRDRAVEGRAGYLVLTPLRVEPAGGGGAAAVLPVVRGWVAADDVAGAADVRGVADAAGVDEGATPRGEPAAGAGTLGDDPALAVPTGQVSVRGWLQPSEASGDLDVDAATTDAISSAQLVNVWGGPIYSGYLVLAGSEPSQPSGLALLPRPDVTDGGDLDLRNLGYALQWWIFGLFAVGLWLRTVRDEARGERRPGEGDHAASHAAADAVRAPGGAGASP